MSKPNGIIIGWIIPSSQLYALSDWWPFPSDGESPEIMHESLEASRERRYGDNGMAPDWAKNLHEVAEKFKAVLR